jgi:hypothetical protein
MNHVRLLLDYEIVLFDSSENAMPSIGGSDKVEVTSGVEKKFSLTGHDDDAGDTVTFHQVGSGQPGVVLDPQTGQVTYTPDFNTPVDLR